MSKACYKCMRVLVIIFNFLFVLIGVAVLGCAIFLYVDDTAKDLLDLTGRSEYINIALYVFMGVGGVVLLIGLFGCCGAYHESQCLLAIYFIFLLLIFAAQVAAGVMGFIFKNEALKTIDSRLTALVKQRKETKKISSIDLLQKMFMCCGAKGRGDYGITDVPASCCNTQRSATLCKKAAKFITPLNAYNTGCIDAYKKYAESKFFIILIVVLSVAFVELLGLIFAICLCCNVRSRERAYQTVETHDGHHYS